VLALSLHFFLRKWFSTGTGRYPTAQR